MIMIRRVISLYSSSTGTLGSINLLDVFPLHHSTLVAAKTPLGKLVDTLVCGRSSRLDHIEDALLVRAEANNLAGKRTAHLGALGSDLNKCVCVRERVEWEGKGERESNVMMMMMPRSDMTKTNDRNGILHPSMTIQYAPSWWQLSVRGAPFAP